MARTTSRQNFRPSSHHSIDTMWTVRYGERIAAKFGLNRPHQPLSYAWHKDTTAADRLAVEIARVYAEQVTADDEGRWSDSGSLGAAATQMTEAYTHLAAVYGHPYVMDSEPFNGADL